MPELKPKVRLVYTACLHEVTDGYAFPRHVMAVPHPMLNNEVYNKWVDEVAKNPYNVDTRACYIKIGEVRG